jgi:hypothetical protein
MVLEVPEVAAPWVKLEPVLEPITAKVLSLGSGVRTLSAPHLPGGSFWSSLWIFVLLLLLCVFSNRYHPHATGPGLSPFFSLFVIPV